ncbi:MAG: hypothetical protein OXU35_10080 [Acidobacteriota bacterium]|nr:hypothetical protein [Acidobacteriota bacterium]MDE2972642.1 hypothetical protein [Acidobacteriota bacterium]
MGKKREGKEAPQREPDPRIRELLKLMEALEADGVFDEEAKSAVAAFLGRLGGLKGGPARAKKLSPERRSEIARLAVEARWKKARESD